MLLRCNLRSLSFNLTPGCLGVSDQILLIRVQMQGPGGVTEAVRSRLAGSWSSCAQVCWVPRLGPCPGRRDFALSGVTGPWCWDFACRERQPGKTGQDLCSADVLPWFGYVSSELSWKGLEGRQHNGSCVGCQEESIVFKARSGEYPSATAIVSLPGIHNW